MDMEVEESKPKIEAAPVEKKHIPPFLDHAALEESWFTEYTGREPQQTPKITSAEQFDQLQVEKLDHCWELQIRVRNSLMIEFNAAK